MPGCSLVINAVKICVGTTCVCVYKYVVYHSYAVFAENRAKHTRSSLAIIITFDNHRQQFTAADLMQAVNVVLRIMSSHRDGTGSGFLTRDPTRPDPSK